jgi:S-adenosylmethionine-diacylgycerolhomoserine-N-methlytransferase
MGLVSDLRILYHLTFTRVRGDSHGERLEAFYGQQAADYDSFRERLLHGRAEMMRSLEIPQGALMLDLGGGTGSNVEYLGENRKRLQCLRIVDLCPSLLKTASERIARHGWTHVETVLADVTTYQPPERLVDVITFSYSLTMIPNWFAALERAYHLLKPGGIVGVVDFYISRKWPGTGLRRHSGLGRFFWPTWFCWDNVFLSPDHLPWLLDRFETVRLEERAGKVPYLMGLKAPYYIFVGRKRA